MRNFSGNATRWLRYAMVALCCFAGAAIGNPVGGNVSAGTASVATSGTTVTITQNSQEAVVNWTDFSIGAGETVNIVQPSAASSVLLRVVGSNPSLLLGTLQSNGKICIINSTGILFGASVRVDVAGMAASTLQISDQNFMAGQLQFSSSAGQSTIVNEGAITATSGGAVILISPSIKNAGIISAASGEILLAAGTSVDLTTLATPVVSDAAGAPVSTVESSGQLLAQNGKIGIYTGGVTWTGSVTGTNLGTLSNIGSANVTNSFSNIGLANIGLDNGTNSGTLTNASFTLPTGGQVSVGAGSIAQSGANLNVTQTTQNAVINWGAFNIGSGNSVSFAQPNASSVVLNRVTGSDPTQIFGQLTSNGKIFLVNPSGVLFGTTGILDVGALATSTGSPTNATSLGISTDMQVNTGWNILGNSTDAPLDVASFVDANNVGTVWKWNQTTGRWAFYSPSLAGQALTDYAASKGYDVLASINSGEGFWVNAKAPFTFALPIGKLLVAASFQTTLKPGWNLVSVGENNTPKQFNDALSQVQSASGVATLWAWDKIQSKWYFYAPDMEAQGGTVLADYIAAKGYLDFTVASKTLRPGMGFWVNKP